MNFVSRVFAKQKLGLCVTYCSLLKPLLSVLWRYTAHRSNFPSPTMLMNNFIDATKQSDETEVTKNKNHF